MRLKFALAGAAFCIAFVPLAWGETITVGGVDRSFILDAAPGPGPHPLIVALHGGGGSAPEFKADSGLTPVANAAGVSVVYPESLSRQWNDGRVGPWNKKVSQADDFGFLQGLVQDLVRRGVADPARITFTGISNGGMMSYAMACTTQLPIYAIMPVSANVDAGQDCSGAKVRLLNIVGTQDKVVPMQGGKVLFGFGQGAVESSDASFKMFLKAARCNGTDSHAMPNPAADGMTSVVTLGRGCAIAPVAQIVVSGGGHAWPGGQARLPRLLGYPTQDFQASQLAVQLATGETNF